MPYKPAFHNRHSIRLPGYDYAQRGAYFLTILTHKKEQLFGEVVGGVVKLSPVGEVVHEEWLKIPSHFSNVVLDAFVIMPDHMHGIVVITEDKVGESLTTPPRLGSQPGSIPAIVQNFKSITSRKINKLLKSPGSTIWHRNYYEHIIRDEEDYERIVAYIQQNPQKWARQSP